MRSLAALSSRDALMRLDRRSDPDEVALALISRDTLKA